MFNNLTKGSSLHTKRAQEWCQKGKELGYEVRTEYLIEETGDTIDCVWFSKNNTLTFIEVELGKFSPQVWKNMTKGNHLGPSLLIFDCQYKQTVDQILQRAKFIQIPIKVISREDDKTHQTNQNVKNAQSFVVDVKRNPYSVRQMDIMFEILLDLDIHKEGVKKSRYIPQYSKVFDTLVKHGLVKEIGRFLNKRYVRDYSVTKLMGYDLKQLYKYFYNTYYKNFEECTSVEKDVAQLF